MQKTFEVHAPPEIEIRLAAGEIEVDASLEGSVEVELIAGDESSRRLVEDALVELHGSRLAVHVPQRRGGFGLSLGRQGITCRVRCPRGSRLAVRAKSADVSVSGRLDALDVTTTSGDVEAEAVDGGLNVRSASGDVHVRSVRGRTSVQTASGDVEVETMLGAANVATASGDVSIGEAYDDVVVSTVSGDQEHEAVMRGNVSTHSVSGDIRIGVRRGSKAHLDCNTVSGDTTSELELSPEPPADGGPLLDVRAKTVSGDIRITRAPAPASEHQEVHA